MTEKHRQAQIEAARKWITNQRQWHDGSRNIHLDTCWQCLTEALDKPVEEIFASKCVQAVCSEASMVSYGDITERIKKPSSEPVDEGMPGEIYIHPDLQYWHAQLDLKAWPDATRYVRSDLVRGHK